MKSNEEVLNLVYQIRDDLEYEVDEKNIVTIIKRQEHWVQRFFRKLRFKIPEITYIKLDSYSSFIFLNIDGNRTVKEIGEIMDEKYGEEAKPLYERLLLFLNHIEVNAKYIVRMEKDFVEINRDKDGSLENIDE
ncbi:PqqD family protein [Metaclostridioides mangenotii]|uniref:PqqD family protein n=1 Tax=Metaclostridioides mangenotii TaxID=1540 RepID=UPI000465CF2A|nr:PqqD family protein [Clostridioides mangenotii]